MSNNKYTSIFERAKAYPFVNYATFDASRRICCDTGAMSIVTTPVKFSLSPFPIQLTGAAIPVPAYNIAFNDGSRMDDRIAMIAIGSNSSPQVMMDKLTRDQIGGEFFLAQAYIKQHAVVHGAFIGAAGTVPSTVTPQAQSNTHITVSFLTAAQAQKLTEAEPNYDLVLTNTPLHLIGIPYSKPIADGALVYVSPWGLLSKDGKTPLAQLAIPAWTPLPFVSSEEAVRLVAHKVCPHLTAEQFFNQMSLSVLSRLLTNTTLQIDAVPSSITGTQVRSSIMAAEALAHGMPIPRLHYNRP